MYIGGLSTLILVAVLAVGSLSLVYHVGNLGNQRDMLRGVMYLATQQVIAEEGDIRYVSQALHEHVVVQPLNADNFPLLTRMRLQNEQLVVEERAGRLLAHQPFLFHNQHYVLSVAIGEFRTAQIQGAFALLDQALRRHLPDQDMYWQNLSKHFGFPLRRLDSVSAELAAELGMRSAPEHVAHYDVSGSQGSFTAWFPSLNQYVELGPIHFRQPLSLTAIIVVVLLSLMLTGISVYWLVYQLETRLRRLERATSRIAQGHLSARVQVQSNDSISLLGDAFNRMAEHIQRLISVQREMIRAVSHELRTPVARMRFGIQMLEDTVEIPSVQKQLRAMDGDVQELDELIDEILTYARLEEGGPILDFKEGDVVDICRQVVAETRRRTNAVEVNMGPGEWSEEDRLAEIEARYLHRAVQNLVGNACRYAKTQVLVNYEIQDGVCRIDVEDDGQGIPEADWERVFTPFARLDDSRTRSSGGYGLGLSIVRRIVYWHGGRAIVGRSRFGGAKFSLIWPKVNQLGQE